MRPSQKKPLPTGKVHFAMPSAGPSDPEYSGNASKGVALARHEIGALVHHAIDGDEKSADELTSLAADATLAVEQLFDRHPGLVKRIVQHREHFPILITRRRGERAKRDAITEQVLAILGSALPVDFGRRSQSGNAAGRLRAQNLNVTVECALQLFDAIRGRNLRSGSPPQGWTNHEWERFQERVRKLPPELKSSSVRKKWAKALRDWIFVSFFHVVPLVDQVAAKRRRQSRSAKRFKEATGVHPTDFLKKSESERIELAMGLNDKLDPTLVAERLAQRARKGRNLKATESDFKEELRAEIEKCLRTVSGK